jgi:hypothetical protein
MVPCLPGHPVGRCPGYLFTRSRISRLSRPPSWRPSIDRASFMARGTRAASFLPWEAIHIRSGPVRTGLERVRRPDIDHRDVRGGGSRSARLPGRRMGGRDDRLLFSPISNLTAMSAQFAKIARRRLGSRSRTYPSGCPVGEGEVGRSRELSRNHPQNSRNPRKCLLGPNSANSADFADGFLVNIEGGQAGDAVWGRSRIPRRFRSKSRSHRRPLDKVQKPGRLNKIARHAVECTE